MTLTSRLLGLYPAFHLAGLFAIVALGICYNCGFSAVLCGLFWLYLVPPISFRIHRRIFGRSPRSTNLLNKKYSPWWGGHQMQTVFIAVPALEGLLRLIPGCYSAWLRMWGAKIGKRVYWTPGVEIMDRDLLVVGDDVILGHKTEIFAHVIKPTEHGLILLCKEIRIGNRVFLGAGNRMGPGVVIEDGVSLPILQDIYPGTRVTLEWAKNKQAPGGARATATQGPQLVTQ